MKSIYKKNTFNRCKLNIAADGSNTVRLLSFFSDWLPVKKWSSITELLQEYFTPHNGANVRFNLNLTNVFPAGF